MLLTAAASHTTDVEQAEPGLLKKTRAITRSNGQSSTAILTALAVDARKSNFTCLPSQTRWLQYTPETLNPVTTQDHLISTNNDIIESVNLTTELVLVVLVASSHQKNAEHMSSI